MRRIVIIGVALLSMTLVACGGDEATEDTGTEAGGGEGAAEATVTASNAMFDPEELTIAAGGTVEFVNEDDFEHSFTVRDTDVHEELEDAGSVTVDLSGLAEGSYTFFCEYHPDTMEGMLEITP